MCWKSIQRHYDALRGATEWAVVRAIIDHMVLGDPFLDPARPDPPRGPKRGPYRPEPRTDRPPPLAPKGSQPSQRRQNPAPARTGDWRDDRMGPPRRPGATTRQRTVHDPAGGAGFRADIAGFRADIEGLRAIAVILVILYHFEIGPFEGGLVGVDVFFVLSGFLITSLLVREMQRTDHISLANFWARRMRRLLPASAFVVIATLVAGRALLSPIELRSLGHDALAASTFVINIVFGRRASDYLGAQAAESSPSALLHFWSLAVEEQFYVVWPLVVFSLRRAHDRMRALGVAVGGLLVVSLVACLFYTDRAPVWAFYLLPTRAWELLVGAGLALIGARVVRIPEQVRAVMGWGGLAGIVIAALLIEETTPFPGVAALLPVLATAAVVAAGGAITPRGPLAV